MLEHIGNYEVKDRIGRGGTADVFLGFQASLNRTVAIKVLAPEFVADDRVLERFRREKDAIAALVHPNIITIYEYIEEQGLYCYVMEHLEARTLSDVLKEETTVDESRSAKIMIQLMAALEYAHGRGIIHRDIKPGNIFVDDEDRLKLTDFGLAKDLHKSSDLTQTRQPIGTPYYMAPEQVRGEATDVTTDIYQSGVVLYHLLTGHVPFPGRTPYEVTNKVLKDKIAFDDTEREVISPSLRAIILTATSKVKEDRYPSAEAFRKDLERVQSGDVIMGVANPEVAEYYKRGVKHGMLVCKKLDIEIQLVKSMTFIGRGPGVDVTIPDTSLQPKQAMIKFINGQYMLVGSNKDVGITVNGEPIFGKPDRMLEDGDRIKIVGNDFVFIDPR